MAICCKMPNFADNTQNSAFKQTFQRIADSFSLYFADQLIKGRCNVLQFKHLPTSTSCMHCIDK